MAAEEGNRSFSSRLVHVARPLVAAAARLIEPLGETRQTFNSKGSLPLTGSESTFKPVVNCVNQRLDTLFV
jgi:hypothetical protein